MSRPTREEIEVIKLRSRCDTCGARAGEQCTRVVKHAPAGVDAVYFGRREGPPREHPHVCRGTPVKLAKPTPPKRSLNLGTS